MPDGTVYAFDIDSASLAVEYADLKYPGYVRIEMKSHNAHIQRFGRPRAH